MTTIANLSLTDLTDPELLAQVKRLADRERSATAALIAALAEVDRRKLYLGEGFSSMFTYCTGALRLSEHAAYSRIEAARAARRFPVILERLADGKLTLTAVGLLAPHLTAENHRDVLESACHKSKRDVERIVAGLRPQPDVPATVRKLPTPRPALANVEETPRPVAGGVTLVAPPAVVSPASRPAITALAPERYKLQLTIDKNTLDRLRRVQDLMRHTIPSGDPAAIFARALVSLLAELERTRLGATTRPRRQRGVAAGSRHIPAAVRRAVWSRDGGQCAFIGASGQCTERGFFEFHHVVPFAAGGEATIENVSLRCRAHNNYESAQFFGLFADSVRESSPRYPIV